MIFNKNGPRWWRRFLDLAPDESTNTVDILRQRYIDEMQRIGRFKQYAEKMHYPQYREKFVQMAAEKSQHAERIGARIVALGGRLPDVAVHGSTNENSWRALSMALEEENRSTDRLAEQLRSIASEHSDIVKLLQQISLEQEHHRGEIRQMLMRSDPFALSLA